MEIPMKLQKLVDHLDAEYKRRLEFLAQKLLNEHVIPVAALRDALKLSKSYPDTFTRFTFRADMAYVEDFSESLAELEVLSISLVMSTFFDVPEFFLEALVDNTEESILEFPLDISKHLYDDIFGAQNA